MNPLLERLATLRRGYWVLSILSGSLAILALVAFAVCLEGLFDFQTHAPTLVRAVFLMTLLAGCGCLLFWLTLYPLAKRTDNLSLALRVEEAYPELNDSLASTVQFLEYAESDPVAVKMQQAAIARAAAQTEGLDFRRVLRYQPVLLLTLVAVAGAGLCAYFGLAHPEYSRTALLRLADPFGNHTWTTIHVAEPKTVWPVGKILNLKGEVYGIEPKVVRFDLEVEDAKTKQWVARPDKKVKLTRRNPTDLEWTFQVDRIELENRKAKVRYRISGNDGQFPPTRGSWQIMNVEYPPQIQSTQIELHLPDYLGMPSPEPSHRSLQLKLGTVVDFKATLTRPVREAVLELRPASPVQSVSAALSLLGLGEVGPALVTGLAVQNTIGRIPFEIEGDGNAIRARFMPLALGNGTYHLSLIDKETTDLTFEEKSDLIVANDPLPRVELKLPASSGDYLPDAEIQFEVEAWDELYGLKNIFLEVRKKTADGKEDETPALRILADPRLAGAPLRQLGGLPVPWENLAAIRPPQLKATRVWPLKNEFQDGDVLLVRACAGDYFDVFSGREPGRNANVIEIRIVDEKAIAKNIDQKMADVQADLLRLKKKQEAAQDMLKEVKSDKIDQKGFDQLLEAAEAQKAIKEAAADLQKKIDDAQRMLKENKWPNAEEKDLLRNIDGELDRMAQQDFPKLDAELNQAKKEAAGLKKPMDPEKKGGKKEDDKTPLDKAKDLQQDIKQSLDDLNKSVSKWADLAQKKMELRELIGQQERVAKETKQIQEKIDELKNSGLDRKEIEEAQKRLELDKRLENVANDQKNVGKETSKFLDNLDGLKDRLQEKGDKEGAQKVGDAKQVGDKNSLPKKMSTDIPNQLKNENEMKQAMQNQADAGKAMKEMLGKLEGNREDALDRLQKKEKKVKDAKDDLDKLIKKGEDAGKINDPMKQGEELQRLADAAREEAKELQRLGEQRAAREVENAAKQLDAAAKKAGMGEDNKEQQKEALDRLNEARGQLEEFEEQLAREQLAKIADRLQFLKERQDAAIERTKDLHKKVVARKSWSMALLKTLDGDQKNQDSIAKDAVSLRDKLKGAPVFEAILDMAGQSMEKAATAQKERKDVGKDRQFGPGQAMDEDEMKDEESRQGSILRQQNQAAARLQRLLDAANEQPVAKKKPKKEQDPNMPPMEGMNDDMNKGGIRPQDGLPPMAELKALKGEQEDLLKRTKDFHESHPDLTRLNEQDRQEFDTIQTEQNRLRNLFDRMMDKAQKGVQQ